MPLLPLSMQPPSWLGQTTHLAGGGCLSMCMCGHGRARFRQLFSAKSMVPSSLAFLYLVSLCLLPYFLLHPFKLLLYGLSWRNGHCSISIAKKTGIGRAWGDWTCCCMSRKKKEWAGLCTKDGKQQQHKGDFFICVVGGNEAGFVLLIAAALRAVI